MRPLTQRYIQYGKIMEFISQIWPFSPGQQETIFQVAGFAIIGIILLNVVSTIRQKLPISKVISGLFTFVPNQNKIEKTIGKILYALLILGFFIVVIDVLVNGNQIVNIGIHK